MIRNRTIDDYKLAGAWMRLCKTVLAKTYTNCGAVLSKTDCQKFNTVTNKISSLCSKAEDNMFADFPHIGNDALDIFYGSASVPPRTETDADQVRLMRQLVIDMFGANWECDELKSNDTAPDAVSDK